MNARSEIRTHDHLKILSVLIVLFLTAPAGFAQKTMTFPTRAASLGGAAPQKPAPAPVKKVGPPPEAPAPAFPVGLLVLAGGLAVAAFLVADARREKRQLRDLQDFARLTHDLNSEYIQRI